LTAVLTVKNLHGRCPSDGLVRQRGFEGIALQVGTAKVGLAQPGLLHGGAGQTSTLEGGAMEVGMIEVGHRRVAAAEQEINRNRGAARAAVANGAGWILLASMAEI
jgi:hypothetical protein